MTMETDLRALILPICSRVFNGPAPISTARPYVTFQQVGGEVVTFVGREVPSKRNAEVQINVWSNTTAEASSLALQIEAAMIGATAFQAMPLSAFSADYDPDVPIYGAMQDFSIWADR